MGCEVECDLSMSFNCNTAATKLKCPKSSEKMNLLWALDWCWRLAVIWTGWAWLQRGAVISVQRWTEGAIRVCLCLYMACVAMRSSRFLPFISSLFKPTENILCTWATPPEPPWRRRLCAHRCIPCTHTYTAAPANPAQPKEHCYGKGGLQVFQDWTIILSILRTTPWFCHCVILSQRHGC